MPSDETGHVIDNRAYVLAALDVFRAGLKRRDVFVPAGVRYADPRAGFAERRCLERCTPDRLPLARAIAGCRGGDGRSLTSRLDLAWQPDSPPTCRTTRPPGSSTGNGRDELVLSPLDKVERPPSLVALQSAISARMPKIDLPDVMLEVAARSGFADAFTHVSERHSRVEDFATSLCGGLIAQACNIGFEPLVRTDQPALSRARLSWVSQNFIRPETIAAANSRIVAAQNALPIARISGEAARWPRPTASAFVAPAGAIHAGPNPKYFGAGRGITYYNLVSDQFTGLNAVVVPGTLRDSLLILGLLLGQETDLDANRDHDRYRSLRRHGVRAVLAARIPAQPAGSPILATARFWRIDQDAPDYGPLNGARAATASTSTSITQTTGKICCDLAGIVEAWAASMPAPSCASCR